MNLMISNIVRDDATNTAFGFASNEEGDEFFIPRALIYRHNITPDDVSIYFEGKTRPNPSPAEGRANLPHVTMITAFEGED